MNTYEVEVDGQTYEVEAASESQLPQIVEKIRADNPQKTMGQTLQELPGQMWEGAKGMVQGNPDPAMSHVPEVNPNIMNKEPTLGNLMREPSGFAAPAKMMTSNDKEYAEVMNQRLLSMGYKSEIFQDANGGWMISYVTPDGAKSETRYVNKPGLGFEDIDRAAAQVAMYAPAARGAAIATRGAGMGSALVAQGAGAGATSLGTDAVAASQGSQTGVNEAGQDALLAAGFGAGGEALGRIVRPMFDFFRARNMINADGTLKPAAQQVLRDKGIDPETISPEFVQQYARDAVRSGTPDSAARKALYDQEGIPATRGLVTRNIEDLKIEREMGKGRFGQEAQEIMTDRLNEADNFGGMTARRTEQMTGQQPTIPDEAGQAMVDRIQTDWKTGSQAASDKFDSVSRESLRVQRRQPSSLKHLDPKIVDEINGLAGETPSREALGMLDKFSRAALRTDPVMQGAESKPMSLMDMRDRFTALAARAKNDNQEYRRVAKVRDAFDQYVVDLAKRGEPGIPAQEFQNYVQAYDMKRQLKAKYLPRGKNDLGGQFVKKVIEKQDLTPSALVDEMFGATFKPRLNSVAATKRVLEVLGPDSDEANLLRATIITKATQNKAGNMLTPPKMIENIESVLANKAAREMLGPRGVMELGKFKRELQTMRRPDVPAGDSRALQQNIRTRRDSVLQYLLKAKGSGERFSGNPAGATFWHVIARTLPKGMAVADIAGKRAVKQHTQNVLPTRPSRGYGSAAGQVGRFMDEEN